jgi:hypothetical protein
MARGLPAARGIALAAVAVVAAGAGCVWDPDWSGSAYRCETGECPSGMICVAQRCVSEKPGDSDAGEVDAGLDAAVDGAPDAAPDAGPLVNLISNPGAEDGLTGWIAYESELRLTPNTPHSGAQAIVVCKDPPRMANTLFTVYRDFGSAATIAQGQRYVAEIWVRASFRSENEPPTELPPPSLHLRLRERGGAQNFKDHVGPAVSPITTTWVRLTVEGTIEQADRTGLSLIVWPGDVPDDRCFAVDDAFAALVP